jgi:Inner membrane protein YgaP-like, transmembrane domain
MLYTKNLPAWERAARVVAGIVMALCGFIGPGLAGTAVGLVVAAAGGMTLLTGFFGFCPACALAGRRLKTQAARPNG